MIWKSLDELSWAIWKKAVGRVFFLADMKWATLEQVFIVLYGWQALRPNLRLCHQLCKCSADRLTHRYFEFLENLRVDANTVPTIV